jgi:hypothetical protein
LICGAQCFARSQFKFEIHGKAVAIDGRPMPARGRLFFPGTRLAVPPFSETPGRFCSSSTGSPWLVKIRRKQMMSETQVHTIARQMLDRHGAVAIAHAAQNALTCEQKGQLEEANEWRHVKDAMKIMQGPHQS